MLFHRHELDIFFSFSFEKREISSESWMRTIPATQPSTKRMQTYETTIERVKPRDEYFPTSQSEARDWSEASWPWYARDSSGSDSRNTRHPRPNESVRVHVSFLHDFPSEDDSSHRLDVASLRSLWIPWPGT